jgi:hypothetical protein
VPNWDIERPRYEIKVPPEGCDFEHLVAGLAELTPEHSTAILTVTRPDASVLQKRWRGLQTPEELAAMLAEADSLVLQVVYADRSRLWLADGVRRHDRWRWTTAGAAQDAAHKFTRVLRKHRKRRLLTIAWPMALIMATVLAFASLGFDQQDGSTPETEFPRYVGPLWYTVLSVLAVLVGLIGIHITDATGFGRSRRRYLKRLAVPARHFSWRRFFEIRPLDLTNGVFAALVIGLVAGVLLVLIVGK